jgi:hypothetical protein
VPVLLGLFVFLAANANHGRQNADASLAAFHFSTHLVPRVQAGNAGCVGLLSCDLQNVAQAVIVESSHRCEVGGESSG